MINNNICLYHSTKAPGRLAKSFPFDFDKKARSMTWNSVLSTATTINVSLLASLNATVLRCTCALVNEIGY